VARARDIAQCEQLTLAGATDVVPEIVEGSLQLGGCLLRQIGDSREQVQQVLEAFRRATYARLGEIGVSRAVDGPQPGQRSGIAAP
jgi:voltage-gated potassium channel Kch